MSIADPLGILLPKLQKKDGELWLRILGEYQSEFNEIPFWVLVKDKSQILPAIRYLQENLLEFQKEVKEDITVSFLSKTNSKTYRYGIFKGNDFFRDFSKLIIYDPPIESDRNADLFDYVYPNEGLE